MRAMVITERDGKPIARLEDIAESELPPHEVLVEVAYSSLNYKDGLAISGKGKIARRLPMVAGIDLAGVVKESTVPRWRPGDSVLVNGWGLSEVHWGGYCDRVRVKDEWLTALPPGLSTKQAMAIGTAGYTAMLCVMALEQGGVAPSGSEVLVTGAAGGVGSVAIALLSGLGYRVTASTGRPETHEYLRELGASQIIDREELSQAGTPLQKERWSGVIDSVGGQTLVTAISQLRYGGVAAACGLAGGTGFPGTVLPFILRGVSLQGVDSVMAPQAKRAVAWERLAKQLPLEKLDAITTTEPMSNLANLAELIVAGKTRGRVVIDVKS
jgi:acrylyl-CoA reductase (NADPH)